MRHQHGELVLPEIHVERNTRVALHQQIRRQLEPALRAAAPGSRLPSTRVLASLLGVSRNTVMTAYEELAADGLIRGKPGAAVFVEANPKGGRLMLDPSRLLREAQFPTRIVCVCDPDGTPLYLIY